MNDNSFPAALVAVVSAGTLVGGYAKLWEHFAPNQPIANAVVVSAEPYHSRGGEIHWSSSGFRVRISGVEQPIDFPTNKWDPNIKQGDSVDVTVRSSFPWFCVDQLDGLEVMVANKSIPQ